MRRNTPQHKPLYYKALRRVESRSMQHGCNTIKKTAAHFRTAARGLRVVCASALAGGESAGTV